MKTKYLLLLLLTSVAIGGIVLAAANYRKAGGRQLAKALVVRPTSAASPEIPVQAIGPIRNLRFTLFERGIRPSEMRIKAGLVNVMMEDKTYVSQGLAINRVVGDERMSLGTVQKAANQLRGRCAFQLLPGEYELYDASKPANKALLIVEP